MSKSRSHTLTNEDKLNKIGFKGKISDDFLDTLTFKVMDLPVKLFNTNPDGAIVCNSIVDYSTVENDNYFKKNDQGKHLNPTTSTVVNQGIILVQQTLKEDIEAFVAGAIQDHVCKQFEAVEEHIRQLIEEKMPSDTHHAFSSNANILDALARDINIPSSFLAPVNFTQSSFAASNAVRIMTFPVILDDETQRLDFCDLNLWRSTNDKAWINPFTSQPLSWIEFDDALYVALNKFVKDQQLNGLLTQLDAIHEKINNAPIIQRKQTVPAAIPPELVCENFSGECITHPVRLDGKYVVDFMELKQWWTNEEGNQFKNFYTGQLIKTIKYDADLKAQIDEFMDDPNLFYRRKSLQERIKNQIAGDHSPIVSRQHLFFNPQFGLHQIVNAVNDEKNGPKQASSLGHGYDID